MDLPAGGSSRRSLSACQPLAGAAGWGCSKPVKVQRRASATGVIVVRMTYALRACSRALLTGSKPVLASRSQAAGGGDRWLLMAVRGHLGDTHPVAWDAVPGPPSQCQAADGGLRGPSR